LPRLHLHDQRPQQRRLRDARRFDVNPIGSDIEARRKGRPA